MTGNLSTPEPGDPLPVLVLGVLGLVFLPAATLAWLLGNRYLRRCGVHGLAPEPAGRNGRTLGMVGTFFWVPSLLLLCTAGSLAVALSGG